MTMNFIIIVKIYTNKICQNFYKRMRSIRASEYHCQINCQMRFNNCHFDFLDNILSKFDNVIFNG
jgi:hypothetical protein